MNKRKIGVFNAVLFIVSMLMIPELPTKAQMTEDVKPEVMVSRYWTEETFELGEDTTLYVEFENMSEDITVNGVLITYTSPNHTVIPMYGTSNQVYIDYLTPDEKVVVEIPVVILEPSNGYAIVNFSLEYTMDEYLLTNSSYIEFPIEETSELVVNNVNIISNTMVGANSLIGVSFKNEREEAVKNVRLIISGEIADEDKEIEVGEIAAGQSKYLEAYVHYTKAGETTVSLSVEYEDEKDNLRVAEGGEYIVNVKEDNRDAQPTGNFQTDKTEEAEENTENTSSFKLSGIFLGMAVMVAVVLIGMLIVFVVRMKR